MRKTLTFIALFMIIFALLPFNVNSESNSQTASGNWEQGWVGCFGWTKDVSYSPDGSEIAVAGSSVIHILSSSVFDYKYAGLIEDYEVKVQMMGHIDYVRSISWSPDGKKIASASDDGTVKIWDAETGEELKTFRGHFDRVVSVDWSPDGSMIASGGGRYDRRIMIWDQNTNELLKTIEGAQDDDIASLSFSPDGSKLASSGCKPEPYYIADPYKDSLDFTAKIWDTSTWECLLVLEGHNEGVSSVDWSPDGSRIATSSHDETIKIWDAKNGECIKTFSVPEDESSLVNDVAWSHDGKKVAGCYDYKTPATLYRGGIRVWDVESGEYIASEPLSGPLSIGGTSNYNAADWSNDNKNIAAVGWSAFIMFDSETLDCEIIKPAEQIRAVAWSPDYSRVVAGSYGDSRVIILDAGTGKIITTEFADAIYTFSLDWYGNKIVSGHSNSLISLWNADIDTDTYSIIKTWQGSEWGYVNCVKWSPDGTMIASASDDGQKRPNNERVGVRLWDADGNLKAKLKGHVNSVNSVSWSPDSKKLVSGSSDQTARIWDVESETCEQIITFTDAVQSVAWSPDGTKIACGTYSSINVYDPEGNHITDLGPLRSWVYSLSWSSDSSKIVACSGGGEIKIFDVNTHKELNYLRGYPMNINSYVYSVDWSSENRIVSGGQDGTVRMWNPVLGIDVDTKTKLLSDEETEMSIHVSYMGEPIPGAEITVSSDIGEVTSSPGTTDANGNINIMFYAPTVIRNTTCNIRITASKPGSEYGDGRIVIPINIYPKILLIDVEGGTNVSSGENSTVNIHVSNYVGSVENADVTVSSEYVTPNYGKTDENGNLTITFNAPKTTSEKTCTIMITASKDGYPDAQFAFNINVKPEAEETPILPVIYLLVFILGAIGVTVALLLYVLIHVKRK